MDTTDFKMSEIYDYMLWCILIILNEINSSSKNIKLILVTKHVANYFIIVIIQDQYNYFNKYEILTV